MFLLLLVACYPGPSACDSGFEMHDDGLCYEVASTPTVQDLLDAMTPCDTTSGNGRVDLDTACADGACAGMTYSELNTALDETGTCSENTFTPNTAFCGWTDGISTSFDDTDGNGTPDADSASTYLSLSAPYDGTTTDGLGVGVQLSCFVDSLGPPEVIDYLQQSNQDYAPDLMLWSNVAVTDFLSTDLLPSSDGLADSVQLFP